MMMVQVVEGEMLSLKDLIDSVSNSGSTLLAARDNFLVISGVIIPRLQVS